MWDIILKLIGVIPISCTGTEPNLENKKQNFKKARYPLASP